MKESQPKAIQLHDYRPPGYLIDATELTFELGDRDTTVTARLHLRRNPEAAPSETHSLRLDGKDLELLEVRLDDEPLAGNEYTLDDASLTIAAPKEAFVLTTVTRVDPTGNTALEGLYKSGGMYCTQCEPEGFRRMTYYLDRPDVMARFRTTIVADGDRYPDALSNGNEVAREVLDDGRTAVTWDDPFPKPAYLFALVAGDLEHIQDTFTTRSGREVDLRIYTEAHNIDKVDYAMDALKRAMRWDEQAYGREYDLDNFKIVAVDDFNMGAMENKGLNIFNTSCVLASKRTTTDAGFQRVEAVVAHEYFHNWSGNRVTCRDWFQLSLKEGFTVLRDSQFSADQKSPTLKRIEDANLLRSLQFAEDEGPMAHPVRPESYIEISNFYTLTVYEKGAAVVGMVQTLLGPERFRRGSDLYFERHDGDAVTCEDFVRAMEDANDYDLSQFRRWYAQAGTPRLDVSRDYDAEAGRLTLTVRQSCPPTPGQKDKQPFHIPVAVGLLDASGREMAGAAGEANGYSVRCTPRERVENPRGDGTLVLHLREAEERFVFERCDTRPELSFLRDFSAPVKVRLDRARAELEFLMVHDHDGFARWDAAQTFYTDVLLERVAEPSLAIDAGLLAPVGRLLDEAAHAPDDGEAKALLAEMLTLPSEQLLAEQMDAVDIDGIHAQRDRLKRAIAQQFAERFRAVYDANPSPEPYRPEAADIARRLLRNVALGYLALTAGEAAVTLPVAQYAQADNMTERLAALRHVVWSGAAGAAPERERLLADFLEQFRDEALVVDQWFATQALSPLPGTLERVQALTQHPAFDAGNPNKIRAVVGAFCNQNPVHFHATDGSGYRFLADWVLDLNARNPQIAARLLGPLTHWRRHIPERQRLMRSELQRIQDDDDLSKEVYEVVSKSLAH